MKHLLVLRFSTLGDASMASVVVLSALEQNPDLVISWITRSSVAEYLPKHPRLRYWTLQSTEGIHTPWSVLNWVRVRIREASAEGLPVDAVADLQRNLRTQVITAGLGWRGIRIERIYKDRTGRRSLRLRGAYRSDELVSVTTRMSEVFQRLGLAMTWSTEEAQKSLASPIAPQIAAPTLLLAPLSRHKTKQWPLESAKKLGAFWVGRGGNVILLGDEGEKTRLESLVDPAHKDSYRVHTGLTPSEQFDARRTAHVAVTLDSPHLHLAVQAGLPVVSVWGGTHPKAGFLGLGHPRVDVMQAPDAAYPCRPCSLFGKNLCPLGDVPCMHAITPEVVFERAWTVATQGA